MLEVWLKKVASVLADAWAVGEAARMAAEPLNRTPGEAVPRRKLQQGSKQRASSTCTVRDAGRAKRASRAAGGRREYFFRGAHLPSRIHSAHPWMRDPLMLLPLETVPRLLWASSEQTLRLWRCRA